MNRDSRLVGGANEWGSRYTLSFSNPAPLIIYLVVHCLREYWVFHKHILSSLPTFQVCCSAYLIILRPILRGWRGLSLPKKPWIQP